MGRMYGDANSVLSARVDLHWSEAGPNFKDRIIGDSVIVDIENLANNLTEVSLLVEGSNEFKTALLTKRNETAKIKMPLYDSTGVVQVFVSSPLVQVVIGVEDDTYGRHHDEYVLNTPHQRYNVLNWNSEIVGERLNAVAAMKIVDNWPLGEKPPRLEISHE